jgi:UDP-GlcNAc:undecaprenyl-phosphate GlcNAc-1-phosphate transferase
MWIHPAVVPYLTAFAIAAAISWISIPLVRFWGLRAGVIDRPNERKMHITPVVRVGGISIFLGCLCALLLVWGLGGFVDERGQPLSSAKDYEIWGVTLGGAGFFALGLADDLLQLSPMVRLLWQLAIAAGAWVVGVRIEFISIPWWDIIRFPEWVSLPITMVWLAGMANAINWIDGLDGLAAGVTLIASAVIFVASLFVKQPSAALIAAALAGGCIGFLRYNFKPNSRAEIFMGDGGAYYLGFTLAGVSVLGLVKSVTTIAVVLPYLILAVPILDATSVIFKRLQRGQSPMKPGKDHLHHRLIHAGLSQRMTVLFIYALTLWVGTLALAVSGMPAGGTYAVFSTLLLGYVLWQVWRRISSPTRK